MTNLPIPDELLDALAERIAQRIGATEPVDRPEPWIGVEDAAAHIAAKPARIYELVAQDRIDHRRDGRRLLFRRSLLDAYLAGSREEFSEADR